MVIATRGRGTRLWRGRWPACRSGVPARVALLSAFIDVLANLTDVFDLTGPTISHHLKVLREAGLISGERRGTWIYYRVQPDLLGRLSQVLVPGDPTAQAAPVGTLPVVSA